MQANQARDSAPKSPMVNPAEALLENPQAAISLAKKATKNLLLGRANQLALSTSLRAIKNPSAIDLPHASSNVRKGSRSDDPTARRLYLDITA
jgi:hypothetical protein